MTVTVFIGDEITSAGFRLAGVRVFVPEDDTLLDVFKSSLEFAELLLITAEYSARIPGGLLQEAMLRADSLIAIVPDAAGRIAAADISDEVDRVLGIAT